VWGSCSLSGSGDRNDPRSRNRDRGGDSSEAVERGGVGGGGCRFNKFFLVGWLEAILFFCPYVLQWFVGEPFSLYIPQALSAVQIVLAITFCCQSGKASHCFFAFFVLEEVVLYLTLGVAGLFKLSSGRPSGADAISGGGAEAAAADLGVGFGFVLLTLASLVHRVILVVKLERQRRIRALREAERAYRGRGGNGASGGNEDEVDPAEYQKPPPQYEPPPTYDEAVRIAKEASATLRKEIRNAVSGSYSKLVSLSRGGGSGDHLDRQPSGLVILDPEAAELEAIEQRARVPTDPGPRRHKFLSPMQASFLSLNEIARGARSAPVSGRSSPVPLPPSRPDSAMSGIMNENFSEEKCHSPSPLLLSPEFLLNSIDNNNVTGDGARGDTKVATAVAQVHVV